MCSMKYIKSAGIQPVTFNIILTRDGEELDFSFPPAPPEMISEFGFILANDGRCESGVVQSDEDLLSNLSPILGNAFNGELAMHPRKQVIIALHDTAILGYQRQLVIDPRISNEIGTFWQVYLDQRVFPQSEEEDWQQLMAEIIISEIKDPNADEKLAMDIKNRLIEQAKENF